MVVVVGGVGLTGGWCSVAMVGWQGRWLVRGSGGQPGCVRGGWGPWGAPLDLSLSRHQCAALEIGRKVVRAWTWQCCEPWSSTSPIKAGERVVGVGVGASSD